jgi:hypothetical protein
MLLLRENSVKNPYLVLHQKEQEIARVRKEIAALLTVIPLLGDSRNTSDESDASPDSSAESLATSARNRMSGARTYHPFVETLLKDEVTQAYTRTAQK